MAAYVIKSRDICSKKDPFPRQKNLSNTDISMGRWSKAATARLNNLKKSKNHQKPTPEDVFNDEDEGMNFEEILDSDNSEHFFLDDSETDILGENSDSDDDEVDEVSLRNEADIEHFNAILLEAQAMAVNAEREAAGKKPKRKRM